MGDHRVTAGVAALVAAAFREDQGRIVASLLRSFGDLDLAEDAVQDAAAAALRAWGDGVPDRPGAWLLTSARNRAIDRLRRAGRLEAKTAEMAVALDRRQANADATTMTETVVDVRLRLLFTCCHPALDADAQVALTLRLVVGLTTAQVAAAFLVRTTTMGARLTTARRRIRASGTPLRMPDDHELDDRVDAVLRVVHLTFAQGHLAAGGRRLLDVDLVEDATRLARLVAALLPEDPEAQGLLALILLADSRRDARTQAGRLVLMAAQDRSRWDRRRIAEGTALVEAALRRGQVGRYQLQAAIQAVHAEAAAADDTDWPQIVALYDVLLGLDPSPIVALHRAVAVHHAVGPAAGLRALAPLVEDLDHHHLLHASRATMVAALGDPAAARAAWSRALELTDNAVERRFVADRLGELGH